MRINIVIFAAIAAANFAYAQLGAVPQLQNAPFSAEMQSTNVQTLADGTHITRPEERNNIYRDSLGRTRSEMFRPPMPGSNQTEPVVTNVTIVDPVEGTRYFLNPNNKTAQKLVVQARPQGAPAASPATLQARATQALIMTPSGVVGSIPGGAVINGQAVTGKASKIQSKNESLGTETIEGLAAEGHRTTTTWLAGSAIGNDRDLVTTNETWRSAELGITMLATNSDPRTGVRTTKVVSISRAEPDPALFQVPSDYTITEAPKPPAPQASPIGNRALIP